MTIGVTITRTSRQGPSQKNLINMGIVEQCDDCDGRDDELQGFSKGEVVAEMCAHTQLPYSLFYSSA